MMGFLKNHLNMVKEITDLEMEISMVKKILLAREGKLH
jgi:hypothetical protein